MLGGGQKVNTQKENKTQKQKPGGCVVGVSTPPPISAGNLFAGSSPINTVELYLFDPALLKEGFSAKNPKS